MRAHVNVLSVRAYQMENGCGCAYCAFTSVAEQLIIRIDGRQEFAYDYDLKIKHRWTASAFQRDGGVLLMDWTFKCVHCNARSKFSLITSSLMRDPASYCSQACLDADLAAGFAIRFWKSATDSVAAILPKSRARQVAHHPIKSRPQMLLNYYLRDPDDPEDVYPTKLGIDPDGAIPTADGSPVDVYRLTPDNIVDFIARNWFRNEGTLFLYARPELVQVILTSIKRPRKAMEDTRSEANRDSGKPYKVTHMVASLAGATISGLDGVKIEDGTFYHVFNSNGVSRFRMHARCVKPASSSSSSS